jgi:hypothetical protein
VLTAFGNSKLRFLTTQLLLNRYPYTVRPMLAQPGPPPRFAPAVSTSNLAEDDEFNVEMAFYGIVTLYERFPPPLE